MLRRFRVRRLQPTDTSVVASAIFPCLDITRLEILHFDYDCCIQLYFMLAALPQNTTVPLREITIPLHRPEVSKHCEALASPEVLISLVKTHAPKLETLRLTFAFEASKLPRAFSLAAPIRALSQKLGSQLSRVEIYSGYASTMWNAVFPAGTPLVSTPALCLAALGVPMSSLKFSSTAKVSSSTISSSSGPVLSFASYAVTHTTAAIDPETLSALFDESYPHASRFDYETTLEKFEDFNNIVLTANRNLKPHLVQWVLNRLTTEIDLNSLGSKSASKLFFSFLNGQSPAALLPRLKPLFLESPSTLKRIWSATKICDISDECMSVLLSDREWCKQAAERTGTPGPLANLEVLYHLPASLAAILICHRERVTSKVEGTDLLTWLYSKFNSRESYAAPVKAAWAFYAASEELRSKIDYPPRNRGNRNGFIEIFDTPGLRLELARAMASWKNVLDTQVIRWACFGDRDFCVVDLKAMVLAQLGVEAADLFPLLTAAISDRIWLRMIGVSGKTEADIKSAAEKILEAFPFLPPKIFAFATGQTSYPLKLKEKISTTRKVLCELFYSRKVAQLNLTPPEQGSSSSTDPPGKRRRVK